MGLIPDISPLSSQRSQREAWYADLAWDPEWKPPGIREEATLVTGDRDFRTASDLVEIQWL